MEYQNEKSFNQIKTEYEKNNEEKYPTLLIMQTKYI